MSDSRLKLERRPTPHDVLWIYRILLGRDPENRAVVGEATSAASVDDLRYSVLRSVEFQEKFAGEHGEQQSGKYAHTNRLDLRAETVWHSLLSKREVSLAYNVILGRDIESEAVAVEHVRNTPNLFLLIQSLLESPEYQKKIESRVLLDRFDRWTPFLTEIETSSDVLLFGAYDNGNLGDECQSEALKTYINAISPRSDSLRIRQCSWQRVDKTEPTAAETPFDEILSPDRLRKYRLVIIGGGGLLATPHFPLFDRRWVNGLQSIALPYMIVGVGASREELLDTDRSDAYRSLIGNAVFVSGRDRESLEALKVIRSDVAMVLDPYFATRFGDMRIEKREARPVRVILIPKVPVNESEWQAFGYLLKVQQHCRLTQVDCDSVCFEPELDQPLAHQFPSVKFITEVSDFLCNLSENTIVYSMRYHGIIFSLCNGTTCWALGARKNVNLYEEIGLTDFLISNGANSSIDFSLFGEMHREKIKAYHLMGRSGLGALSEVLHRYLAAQ